MKIIPFHKKPITLLASLLTLTTATYAAPFSVVVAPGTTLPTIVPPGTTAPAFYTVTNLTSDQRNINFIKFLPPNVTQVLGAGLCGTTFNLGPIGSPTASCTLALTVTGSINGNDPIQSNHLFVCAQGGLACAGPNNANTLNVTSGPIQLVALSGGTFPFTSGSNILSSFDGGNTFAQISTDNLGNALPGQFLGDISCTGSGNTARCVSGSFTFAGSSPQLVATFNGGVTWNNISITGAPVSYLPNNVSCSGSGNTGVCVAAGTPPGNSTTYAFISLDGGQTFNAQALAGVATGVSFNSVDCTGNNTTGLCVLAGGDAFLGINSNAFVVESMDGGHTWSVPVIGGVAIPTQTAFQAVSCNQPGGTCVAVGANSSAPNTDGPLAETLDGGVTWQSFTVPGTPATTYNNVHCFGATCVMIGNTSANQLVINRTTDGGATWNNVTLPALPDSQFAALSCLNTGNGGGTCIAGGQTLAGMPLILASFNGGATWAQQSISGLTFTSPSGFTTASCNLINDNLVCIAAGYDSSTLRGFAVKSTDGGHTWTQINSPAIANSGIILGSSVTGSVNTLEAKIASYVNNSNYGFQHALDKIKLKQKA